MEDAHTEHGEQVLVVVSGLPGTGKSAVAAALATRLGAAQLSVDPIEDALMGAGLPPSWETGVAAYEAARVLAEPEPRRGGRPGVAAAVAVPVLALLVMAPSLWRATAPRTTLTPRWPPG